MWYKAKINIKANKRKWISELFYLIQRPQYSKEGWNFECKNWR
jgi:hypothetical protein